MASELRVNTLKDAAGNNSIATSFVAGGSAKVWTKFNGTGSTITTSDSLNESSLTDSGTGRYTVNFTNNTGNTGYAVTGCLGSSNSGIGAGWFSTGNAHSSFSYTVSNTTSSHRISQAHAVTSGQIDYTDVHSVVHGDLA